jgi:hypothetical protein
MIRYLKYFILLVFFISQSCKKDCEQLIVNENILGLDVILNFIGTEGGVMVEIEQACGIFDTNSWCWQEKDSAIWVTGADFTLATDWHWEVDCVGSVVSAIDLLNTTNYERNTEQLEGFGAGSGSFRLASLVRDTMLMVGIATRNSSNLYPMSCGSSFEYTSSIIYYIDSIKIYENYKTNTRINFYITGETENKEVFSERGYLVFSSENLVSSVFNTGAVYSVAVH